MEDWEEKYILDNLARLIKVTNCNVELMASLNPVFSQQDIEIVNSHKTASDKADAFYRTVMKKDGGYDRLALALQTCNQTGALKIILWGYKTNKKPFPVGLRFWEFFLYDDTSWLQEHIAKLKDLSLLNLKTLDLHESDPDSDLTYKEDYTSILGILKESIKGNRMNAKKEFPPNEKTNLNSKLTEFSINVQSIFNECSTNVQSVFNKCSINAQSILMEFYLNIQSILNRSSVHVQSQLREFSIEIRKKYSDYLVKMQSMFNQGSSSAHSLLNQCSFDIQSFSTETQLS